MIYINWEFLTVLLLATPLAMLLAWFIAYRWQEWRHTRQMFRDIQKGQLEKHQDYYRLKGWDAKPRPNVRRA